MLVRQHDESDVETIEDAKEFFPGSLVRHSLYRTTTLGTVVSKVNNSVTVLWSNAPPENAREEMFKTLVSPLRKTVASIQ